MSTIYDSEAETRKHIAEVAKLMLEVMNHLTSRIIKHDRTKLWTEEKKIFDEYTPMLKHLTYGSDEYKRCLASMKPALDHHYAWNRHHPENHKKFSDMSLIDITEMLCDWKAATLRHDDGDIYKSIEINQKRFGYTDEMKSILLRTAKDLLY